MINRRRLPTDRVRLAVAAPHGRSTSALSPGMLYALAKFLACLWMLASGLRIAAFVFAMSALAVWGGPMRRHINRAA